MLAFSRPSCELCRARTGAIWDVLAAAWADAFRARTAGLTPTALSDAPKLSARMATRERHQEVCYLSGLLAQKIVGPFFAGDERFENPEHLLTVNVHAAEVVAEARAVLTRPHPLLE